MKQVTIKVPNGKMLKLFIDVESDVIKEIKITGDFFVHPEEAIEKLEQALTGVAISDVEKVVNEFFANNEVEMVGVGEEDIVKGITQN